MLPGIHGSDFSEFQSVDWDGYWATRDFAIIRVCYGANHTDRQWPTNSAQRGRGHLIALYLYLTAFEDPAAQANAFCDLIGRLNPGELVVIDAEEGQGDQWPRVAAAWQVIDSRLGAGAWDETDYSYGDFELSHLEGLPDGRIHWIAGYGPEPGIAHVLWQHTDGQYGDHDCQPPYPGGPIGDCSVFHGTLDQLRSLFGGGAPQPIAQEDDDMPPLWFKIDIGGGHHYLLNRDSGECRASAGAPFVNYTILGIDDAGQPDEYAFGPGRNEGVFAYPGLPPADRQGGRKFVDAWLG